MPPYITINNHRIGLGEPVYFIAEVGINHNGNPELARKLIDVAKKAGCDAVKFQKRNLKALFPAQTLLDPTREEKEIGYLLPYLQQAELTEEALSELAAYARRQDIEFLCTPWDRDSVDVLLRIGVPAFKVSSPDLVNLQLLEYLGSTGKPLILSTGMSRWSEISLTVKFLKERNIEFALLHCQSTYPAPFKDINLRFMEHLQEFDVPVGYSGHERGIAVSTVAVALGANIIERHITLDRTLPGPDQADSLEPPGLEKQLRDIRNIELALGSHERGLSRGELLNRVSLGKSLVAADDIHPGEVISADKIVLMGPGNGISPQRLNQLVGKVSPREIRQHEQFRECDFTGQNPDEPVRDFPLRWGPVVRYRDVERMARFEPDFFEFHLTDTDLDAGVPEGLPVRSQELVVHAPEYYHGRLIDFAACDMDTVRYSSDVLLRVIETARNLRQHFTGTGERVRIVVHPGGMTYDAAPEMREAMIGRLCETLPPLLAESGVELMIENMPPYPWYFGGQWYHNAFMDAEDLVQVAEVTGCSLCLDISHAALYCTWAKVSLTDLVARLAPYVSHLHVSDASGTDGEGLQINEGDVDFRSLVPMFRSMNVTLVPEIWLGHRNDGEGFIIALHRLADLLAEA